MEKISLIYAQNLINRKAAMAQQELSFVVLVDNLCYDKSVDVVWAGEDGVWHAVPASYHGGADQQREYWLARLTFAVAPDKPLPGNVQFALCYRALGKEYWNNNDGRNYAIQADSGILPGPGRGVVNTGFESRLSDEDSPVRLVVGVDTGLAARAVSIQWSTDNWRTTRQTPCRLATDYWDEAWLSNARNPNHYGCQVWSGALRAADAFRVDYRIRCETRRGIVWDDNFGTSYAIQRPALKVLILNLHCCQEDNQDDKLSQIAKAIGELEVDIVCLQEVAELWNDGQGDWQTNTARIINERLESPYHLVSDWSHLGFERYREGVALLSRYPIRKHSARYVSASQDPFSIHSRKVVMAQIEVPAVGLINVFSSHLSWWEDGFAEQFETLRRWARDEHGSRVVATMLGGDFNIKAGAEGYRLVVAANEYEDQFLLVKSPSLFHRIFEAGDSHWHHELADDRRIDYIFLRKGSALRVTSGRVVFTERDYGTVSDHAGYLMTFVPK
ncbi:endonuclease/exonuclease/phosphatase family protein [Accumulibacter sp.]|uniref:endonuclease/exonuclease/phosphatase family protein n=1 Tax=Accumulibacter sp. TaxID=2053492 RepID=UPI002639DDE8|nr:endonuclease/exonuclease/phosphatase family protein [Accumulibacter sp.]